MLLLQSKENRLASLAVLRRVPTAGTRRDGYTQDYRHIEEFHDGFYDHHRWVSPWTISACNVDSDLMLVGQDWASEEFLERPPSQHIQSLGHDPDLPTNKNSGTCYCGIRQGIWPSLRNKCLCICCRLNVRANSWRTCREAFGLSCYGRWRLSGPRWSYASAAARSMPRVALGHNRQSLKASNFSRAEVFTHGAEVYGVPHVGRLGLAATGGLSNALRIWRQLGERLVQLGMPDSSR